ncbi:MAG: Lipopolysaccharide heptosyltransferase 1 [Phycisphaerae bacterium]|nr:Lipopolysaccharide heptosyltransferase 1 [Phycisphaerae bacterium]
MSDPIRRILIIKPSALGDVVHGLPVLHGLRVVHPAAHIAWMIRPAFADAIRGHRELDEVILFDRRRYGQAWRSPGAMRDLVRWLWGLAERRFDLVVDLQGLFRSGFFSLVSLARRRYGPAGAREFGWLFYNHRIGSNGQARHAVERNYRFAASLGFAHVPPRFELPISDESRRAAAELLAGAGVGAGGRFAALAPGASYGSKRWPAERFAALADHLADRHGIGSVLIGAPGERTVCEAVRSAARCGPADLSGATSVAVMIALLERAAVVVSNDSGPMHIAAALGRPLVAIFGPTDPARTGPWGRPDSVVRAVDDARHHFRHDDDSQVAAVTVERAVATLEEQLKTRGR